MTFRPALVAVVFAVQVAAQMSSITVTQDQDPQLACTLQVRFDPSNPQQKSWFGDPTSPGAKISNYRLYVILDNNSPAVRACDKSSEYFDASRPSDASKLAGSCLLPGNETSACPNPGKHGLRLDRFYVPLLKPLRSDLSYLLIITGVGTNGEIKLPITFDGTVITPDMTIPRSQIKVQSNIALLATEGQSVTAKRATAQGAQPSSESFLGRVVNRTTTTDGILISLDKPLPSGKDSQLTIDGLTDYYGSAVAPKGKITIAGAPMNATDAFVTTSISVTAGVHTTPAFGATGAIAPWHPASYAIFIPSTAIRLDPSVNFDVGSASTQTKNSIMVPAPLSLPIYFGLPSLSPPRNSPDLDKPVPMEGTSPSVLNLSFGPRLEIDTKYGGVNALGELRGELYLPRLSHSASVRQAVLSSGNPAIRNLLELPTNGFAFAPYVEADGGGHLTSNTVSVGKSTVNVPTYDIGRVYIGLYGTIQKSIFSFSLDSSWVDIFSTETIAYTTKTLALLRRVSGWQPNTTAGVSVTFDHAKHYGLTLTYQNGRAAPNFQYLNKVAGGVKVTY